MRDLSGTRDKDDFPAGGDVNSRTLASGLYLPWAYDIEF